MAAPTWDPCEGLGVWWPGRHWALGWVYEGSRISQSQAGARPRGVQRAPLPCRVGVLKEWGTLEVFKQESDAIRFTSEDKSAWRTLEGWRRKDVRDVEGIWEAELTGVWIMVVAGLEREVDGLEWMECGWEVDGMDTPGAWLKTWGQERSHGMENAAYVQEGIEMFLFLIAGIMSSAVLHSLSHV